VNAYYHISKFSWTMSSPRETCLNGKRVMVCNYINRLSWTMSFPRESGPCQKMKSALVLLDPVFPSWKRSEKRKAGDCLLSKKEANDIFLDPVFPSWKRSEKKREQVIFYYPQQNGQNDHPGPCCPHPKDPTWPQYLKWQP